jgi:CitMHS family citrate-Mg2+:H+ or citrate-Ca2+:H+ symporter
MLALLGLVTVIVLLALIMSRLVSPLAALVAVPTAAALAGGFGLQTAQFIVTGVQQTAPVAAMFIFAILFFGVMTDAGTLDPLVDGILRAVGTKPARIVVGTALLGLLVHLDGSGAVTFLVTVPAMLPLYDTLRMDKRVLACVASLAAGVNFLPWTGPTLRASAALHVSTTELFRPLIPVRLGSSALGQMAVSVRRLTDEQQALRRPGRFWINVAVTLALMAAMVSGAVDPAAAFMVGTVAALVLNYPAADLQRARIEAHAKPALTMGSILFAAGAFTGIMKGSGMLGAMAAAMAHAVPPAAARHVPFALGLASMPLSLLFDPDSFYLGALPVLAEAGQALQVPSIQIGQAALLGQMTTGFPVSPLTPAAFLVAGLAGIEFGAHQRYTAPFLFAASVVMTIACVILGVFPL